MQRIVIGIGGGIGSGKSTVAHLFSVLGFPVYDSDCHAKKLYFIPEIKEKVIDLLGEKSYTENGTLDRYYISNIVFQNTELLTSLNKIIHPAVKKDFELWCNNYPISQSVIKESALLFELGLFKECSFNILVTAKKEIRISRVMKRDGLTSEKVERRMKNQKNPELFYNEADLIIQNDNSSLIIPVVSEWIEKINLRK